MSSPADPFKFLLTEKVSHPADPANTFTVIRRWLDVDAPEGTNRFYLLKPHVALRPGDTVGPVAEVELSFAVD